MYKKQGYPHQKLRRRKIWKEKRLVKLDQVNHKCEWCGRSDQPLSIHHPNEINSRTYQYLWEEILEKRLESFLNGDNKRLNYATLYLQVKFEKELKRAKKFLENRAKDENVYCCHNCESRNYSKLTTSKTPKYKCYSCNSIFYRLKTRPRLVTIKKIKSLDNLIQHKKESRSSRLKIVTDIRKIIKTELIQKIIHLLYEDLKSQYKEEIQKLLTLYLNFEDTIVLCRKCHSAVRKGFTICKLCKKHYHTTAYDRCYKCHEKQIEEVNPTAKLIRKFFNISLQEQFERSAECECLKCGRPTYDQIDQYAVYLTEKDLAKEESIGEFCPICFPEYQKQEKKDYFVIKL